MHLDNIFVGDIKRRLLNINLSTIDKEAGVAFCSFTNGEKCFRSSIKNSIVAGVIYGGFVVPGRTCNGTPNIEFHNNVGHSNDGSGAYIFPDPASSGSNLCYQASHYFAYKNRDTPLTTHYNSADIRISDMTFIDGQKGVSIANGGGDWDECIVRMTNINIFGESDENFDCPDGQQGYITSKYGFMTTSANFGAKPLHPDMPSSLPIYKIKSNGSWGASNLLKNVRFIDWKS